MVQAVDGADVDHLWWVEAQIGQRDRDSGLPHGSDAGRRQDGPDRSPAKARRLGLEVERFPGLV
jgi:hypothetical protein